MSGQKKTKIIPHKTKSLIVDDIPQTHDRVLLDADTQIQTLSLKTTNKPTEWAIAEYSKQAHCNDAPLKGYKTNLLQGVMFRNFSTSFLKYRFLYNSMDMITIVMKLYDYKKKMETNYGLVFAALESTMTEMTRKELSKHDNGTSIQGVRLMYFSAGPSFMSCDGEYRLLYNRFRNILHLKESFRPIWVEIEEYLHRVKTRRQWSIYTSYFYPKLEQESRNAEVEYIIKNQLIPDSILLISWFLSIYDEHFKITQTHINNNYRNIFLDYMEEDSKFLTMLVDKYKATTVERFRIAAFRNVNNSNFYNVHELYVHCGFKMIPLSIKEVQDPLKITYKPWREYYVSNKINDIVINAIAPGFPVTLDWFYIKNSRKGLYDNKSQYERMQQGEIAKDILHVLYEAQRNTYFASENLETINKTSVNIKKWISSKFKHLSDKINDPINYIIENIIMSEVTLGFTSEYVGRTVSDILQTIPESKIFNSMLGMPLSDYDYFAKYMFEWCYGLLCLNTKLGIIHSDFHLNNGTIGSLYHPGKDEIANKNKQFRVVYSIDDDHQYVFPNNCYFGSIIDFSRVIIDPNNFERLKDESLPATIELVKNETKFRSTEINSLLNLYIQMFPNKARQREELIVLFKNHFEAVFKLLTSMDIYMFTIRLSRQLKQITYEVNKSIITLIDQINKLAENYVAAEMNHLLEFPDEYSDKILSADWPMLTIIKKVFAEYNQGKKFKTPGVINDIYNYKNDLKYSLSKYELFPEWLKSAKYIDDNGQEAEVTAVSNWRKTVRTEYEEQKIKNLDMMNYIAMRHLQKLA